MKKLLLFLLAPVQIWAQTLPDSTQRKLDSVFARFNASSPGCAVAIIQNGNVVFKKGYGMSNLEYNIPITPASIFHIASESKQYVAFCMLLLEQQGKLNLDDDIRKYLDYVPDFGKKISIRNLIYHTSGLRDQWQLLANAGWQLDDVITQEHVIKLVSKQKALNFEPGSEYSYCNTGYTLMAEIVKKASGLTLRQFAAKYIFEPLGMNDTHFHDDYREIVKNRTYSYYPKTLGGYQHSVLSYSTVGATSLFTTVEDEAKWLMNYETGKVGGKELLEKMYVTGVLNNGKKLSYAFALSIDEYKGWKRIGHGGADAGYRTFACRFPEQNLGIIVFSNLATSGPLLLSTQVADLFLVEKKPAAAVATGNADTNFVKRLQGTYYSEKENICRLVWDNRKLFNRQPGQGSGGNEWSLSPTDKNKYALSNGNILYATLPAAGDSVMEMRLEETNGFTSFRRKPKLSLSEKDSIEYTGTYYNDETEATYYVARKDGRLYLQHRKYADVLLTHRAPDQFGCDYWWMSNIHFLRNKEGAVTAFEVNAGRIMHLRYNKVKK